MPPRGLHGLLAAAGTETGISSEPGRWRSPARDMLPGAGALGVAGIITDSCQLWGRDLRAFRHLGSVQGRRSRPQASPPHLGLSFVLRFVCRGGGAAPPQHPSNKSVLIEDSSVLETTRKRLVKCDLASSLSSLLPLCVHPQ